MSEPKLSPAELVAERKKAAEVAARDAWVDGNTATEIESIADEQPESEPQVPSGTSGKSSSGKPRKRKAVLVEHPTVRKALSRSRVQKTIRIPPLMMVEYEELCERLGTDVAFNEHINEAFAAWLEKRKKMP